MPDKRPRPSSSSHYSSSDEEAKQNSVKEVFEDPNQLNLPSMYQLAHRLELDGGEGKEAPILPLVANKVQQALNKQSIIDKELQLDPSCGYRMLNQTKRVRRNRLPPLPTTSKYFIFANQFALKVEAIIRDLYNFMFTWLEKDDLTFASFQLHFKEKKFALIHLAFPYREYKTQFTTALFQLCFTFLYQDIGDKFPKLDCVYAVKIAVVYTIYMLYITQPAPLQPDPIPVDMNQYLTLVQLLEFFQEQKRDETVYALAKLFSIHAFQTLVEIDHTKYALQQAKLKANKLKEKVPLTVLPNPAPPHIKGQNYFHSNVILKSQMDEIQSSLLDNQLLASMIDIQQLEFEHELNLKQAKVKPTPWVSAALPNSWVSKEMSEGSICDESTMEERIKFLIKLSHQYHKEKKRKLHEIIPKKDK